MKAYFVLFLIFVSVQSHAQSVENPPKDPFGLYLGFSFGAIDANAEDPFTKDVKFKAAELMGGVYWRWIGIEARKGTGLMDETVVVGQNPSTGGDITADVQFSSYQSYFLRIQFENDVARIYALYGQTDAQTSYSSRGNISHTTTTGDAYGLGLGFMVKRNLHINFETKYLIKSEFDSLMMNSVNLEKRF